MSELAMNISTSEMHRSIRLRKANSLEIKTWLGEEKGSQTRRIASRSESVNIPQNLEIVVLPLHTRSLRERLGLHVKRLANVVICHRDRLCPWDALVALHVDATVVGEHLRIIVSACGRSKSRSSSCTFSYTKSIRTVRVQYLSKIRTQIRYTTYPVVMYREANSKVKDELYTWDSIVTWCGVWDRVAIVRIVNSVYWKARLSSIGI
eukprot:2647858-Rhodomonas_salina.12